MRNQIISGSVLDLAAWEQIPDQHVQCCITSPPYWGLRDYGVEGQLGLEKTPEEYVERMVQVFRQVWRVLRDDGTLWLNLGDSYASNSNGSGGPSGKQESNAGAWYEPKTFDLKQCGLKPKDLCGIPWRVALSLQADGWYLRQDIIWHKPNPMPESCRDRCTKAHEYLFLLTKKPRYYCDMEAIKEPAAYPNDNRGARKDSRRGTECNSMSGKTGATRNKRSVWTVVTAPYKEAHFATFPPKLIEPCVLAGTSEKGCCPECGTPWVRVVEKTKTFHSGSGKSGNPIHGKNGAECQGGGDTGDIRKGPCVSSVTTGWEPSCTCKIEIDTGGQHPDGSWISDYVYPQSIPCIVFDPFMGSGTTGMVAVQHGRDYLGMELNPEYIELINKRIATAMPVPLPLLETAHD